jgi:hypothetical protein
MKEQLLKFLQDSQGINSSKRLAGLSGWLVFLGLGVSGGVMLLIKNDVNNFIAILNSLGTISCGALGLSIADHFKKNDVKEIETKKEDIIN